MSLNRAPRLVVIGMPFKNRQGESIVPRAFIHPCFKEGCAEYAAFGFGETWACGSHRNEASILFLQSQRTNKGDTNEQRMENDDLLAGRDGGPRP